MFAIIKTGGKQYLVAPGQKIRIEKLTTEEGKAVLFNDVLLVETDKDLKIGTPLVEGASVKGKVLKQGKAKKLVVFKFKKKSSQQKRKQGHRQFFTDVEITSISN